MANPHKGEVEIAAEGVKYTLCFSSNAIVALEDHLDIGFFDIIDRMRAWSPPMRVVDGKAVPVEEPAEATAARVSKLRVGFCRAVFWACFQEHHPEVTIMDAGRFMKACGGLLGTVALISRAMELALPQTESDGAQNPPKGSRGSRGTGPRS